MSLDKTSLRSQLFTKKISTDLVTNNQVIFNILFDLCTLIDGINGVSNTSYLKRLRYTVGAPAVAGCDYNFVSAANTSEQSIQLGATTVIPATSVISSIKPQTLVSLVGGTATSDIGSSSGDDSFLSSIDLTLINSIYSGGPFSPVIGASSVYFSATPSANWSGLSAWKVQIDIFYIDGSI